MADILGRVGARLKQLRLARNLTQEKLAEAAGLSYKFVGEVERGLGNPTLTTLAALASALQTTVVDLVSDEYRADRVSSREATVLREALDSIESILARRSVTPPQPPARYRIRRRPR